LELTKRMKKGTQNINTEEEIGLNILNFIRCVYLNNQDFFRESFDSKYFGDLEMTFKKDSESLIGHCRAFIKNEYKIIDYLFTENGYELLNEFVKKL
jgi:hypothetical protein